MQNHGFDTELLSFGHTNLKLIYLQNNTQNELRAKRTGRKKNRRKRKQLELSHQRDTCSNPTFSCIVKFQGKEATTQCNLTVFFFT